MTEEAQPLAERVAYLVPLNKLPDDRQSRLLAQSDVLKLKKKQKIFEQGDRDDFTFYVLTGDVEMYADDSLIKRVSGGDGASFQPLAQLQPRQMSAIAKTAVEVLRVKRSLLDQLLSMEDAPEPESGGAGVEVEEAESALGGDWLMTLLQSELFTRIPPANIQDLLDTLETVSYGAGDDIVRQDEPGDFYYVVQSGTCEVVRQGASNREIKLAELVSGDTFGEEALVSGATRNATVRMLQAGELARLTKDDFTRLIRAPLVRSTTREAAQEAAAEGAVLLDVRFEDEHAHNGIEGSSNVPLGVLRSRMDDLDEGREYIAYCDTGGRSSAAAFLLAERGYAVCFIEGGAVEEPLPSAPAEPTTPPEQPPSAETSEADDDGVLAASALKSTLDAELEKARLTIDKAQHLMAEATAMKEQADQIVAKKLADERTRIEQEQARLAAKLEEARKMQETLEAQQKAAEEETLRRQQAVEERVKSLEQKARDRLAEEKSRLESLYKQQAEQLESSQADREAELREQLRQEMAAERSKFEQEFLRTNAELESARQEREQAVAAQAAAQDEARATIEAFKQEQQKMFDEQETLLEGERERLRKEALRIEGLRKEAAQARKAATAAKEQAERELEQARADAADTPEKQSLLDEIEQRASNADRDLQLAIDAETAVDDAARDNEDELERTYDTANEINQLLQKELGEWVDEQERMQESTLQREVLSKQREMIDRIKKRAQQAKTSAAAHNQSLLDEIEQQLGADGD